MEPLDHQDSKHWDTTVDNTDEVEHSIGHYSRQYRCSRTLQQDTTEDNTYVNSRTLHWDTIVENTDVLSHNQSVIKSI